MHPDSWTLAPVAIALWHLRRVSPEPFWCTAYRNTYTLHAAGELGPPLLLSPKRTQVGLEWNFPPLISSHLISFIEGFAYRWINTYSEDFLGGIAMKFFWWCQRRSTTQQCQFPHWPAQWKTTTSICQKPPSEYAKSCRLPILGRGRFLKMEDPLHG